MACEAAPVGGIEWYTGREMHRQEKTFQEYEKTHEMKVRNNPTCKGYKLYQSDRKMELDIHSVRHVR